MVPYSTMSYIKLMPTPWRGRHCAWVADVPLLAFKKKASPLTPEKHELRICANEHVEKKRLEVLAFRSVVAPSFGTPQHCRRYEATCSMGSGHDDSRRDKPLHCCKKTCSKRFHAVGPLRYSPVQNSIDWTFEYSTVLYCNYFNVNKMLISCTLNMDTFTSSTSTWQYLSTSVNATAVTGG